MEVYAYSSETQWIAVQGILSWMLKNYKYKIHMIVLNYDEEERYWEVEINYLN